MIKDLESINIEITSLEEAKERFHDLLSQLIDFTEKNDHLDNWTKIFQNAKETLDYNDISTLEIDGFLPKDCFKLEAYQLIATCQASWVFGGMGSWNDITVNDYELYRRLTSQLYETLCTSIAAATNSYP